MLEYVLRAKTVLPFTRMQIGPYLHNRYIHYSFAQICLWILILMRSIFLIWCRLQSGQIGWFLVSNSTGIKEPINIARWFCRRHLKKSTFINVKKMIDCYYKLTANRGIILWVFPWWCYTWLHVMIHYIILNYNFKLSIKCDTVNHLLNKAKPFVIYQTKIACFYFLTTWICNMELADNSWSVISVTYSHIHD